MNLTRDRMASIGWATILVLVGAMTAALMVRVNAVKSQVQLAERRIVALRQEKEFLETEYETRANQQQLADLNEIDFGYKAPEAGQYLEGQRQLAALSKPRAPDAPAPILMARADPEENARAAGFIPAMVSPLTGKFVSAAVAAEPDDRAERPVTAANLSERLGHVRAPAAGNGVHAE